MRKDFRTVSVRDYLNYCQELHIKRSDDPPLVTSHSSFQRGHQKLLKALERWRNSSFRTKVGCGYCTLSNAHRKCPIPRTAPIL